MKKTKNAVAVTTVMLCVCVMPFISGCAQERAIGAEISVSGNEASEDLEEMTSVEVDEGIDNTAISHGETVDAAKEAVMQLPEGTFDEVSAKLIALQAWVPESREDEDLKWSIYTELTDKQVMFEKEDPSIMDYSNLTMVSREALLGYVVDRMDILEWATKGEVTEEVARMLEEKEYLPEFKEIVAGCGEDEINQLWDAFWNDITQLGAPPRCYYKNDPEVVRSYGEQFVAEMSYEEMTDEQLGAEEDRLKRLAYASEEEHELIKSLIAEIMYYRYVKKD